MNKKGFELSINMIIVIILAIVTLVVALGFITGTIPKLIEQLLGSYPNLTSQPTADNPIVFVPSTVNRGANVKMTIGFYNNEQEDIDATVLPTITCADIPELTIRSIGFVVKVGEKVEYPTVVSVPRNTPSSSYPCFLKISNTQKSFYLDVK